MLHARATDTKQRSSSAQRTSAPRPDAPLHCVPPVTGAVYGNQAMLRAASWMLQRKCSCGGHGPRGGSCEKCPEERIQRRAASAAPAHASAALPAALRGLALSQPGDRFELEAERAATNVLGSASPIESAVAGPAASESVARLGGGQPLPAAARLFYEPRFGYDFSRVRIHTGPEAEEWTRSVNAEAFTVGSDVVFDEDRYQPGTSSGRALLAHELAHVVQQGSGHMQLARRAGSLPAASTILKKVVEVDVKSTENADWEFLTLLDKPGGAKVITVGNGTLLRADKEIPAAQYSGASPGVFLFTVMKDCDHEQPGPDGKAQMGYADSIYVKASSCGIQPKPVQNENAEDAKKPDDITEALAKTVYACERKIKVDIPFPITHTFFRVGSPDPIPSVKSWSLFPRPVEGNSCYFGDVTADGDTDRIAPDATCEAVDLYLECLERQAKSYPKGKYCTRGPNSNTFTYSILKDCLVSRRYPSFVGLPWGAWSDPPPPGTYATKPPDDTVTSCPTTVGC